MIVNRRTFHVKPGCESQAVEWLSNEAKAEKARGGFLGHVRIYVTSIGQFDQVAFEIEFESLAEYETFWATWGARPTTPALMEKWYELIVSGGTNEVWDLAASM
jgi:hypothetical protein